MNEQIKKIAKKLCDESPCHHKCRDTKDCIVEDDAELLINKGKEGYYCYGKKDFCPKAYIGEVCGGCEYYNGEGGEIRELLINENKSNNFDVKSNKRIEEMAKDICKLGISCEECTMLARKTNQTREQYCKAFEYAKRAYNAGYRKQSEGEWIKHCNTYECSVCKEELFIEYAEDYDAIEDWNLHFCRNSGAKMKGGEEK